MKRTKNKFSGQRVELRCSNCGALYEAVRHNLPGKDEDSIDCRQCNEVLKSWKGCFMYSMERLIESPEKEITTKLKP